MSVSRLRRAICPIPSGRVCRPQRRGENGKLLCGAVRSLTEAEYAALEKTHICCTVADVSDDRGVPLPHFHVEGS